MGAAAELREFAEAPAAFLPQAPDATVVDDARFFLSASADGSEAFITRTRFNAGQSGDVLCEARRHARSAKLTLATPSEDIVRAFRGLGFHDPEPPNGATSTALLIDREPERVDGVDVRRISSYDEFLTGIEIELASFAYDDVGASRRRADAEETYRRRRRRPGGEWLAYVDGRAVAYAAAIAGPRGLYLAGGATLPDARGRGCYRALLGARWDDAVARGTPALVVNAHETSRPILERCGFERVCTIHELEGEP